MRPIDGQSFAAITTTSAAILLQGGKYGLVGASFVGTPTLTLQMLINNVAVNTALSVTSGAQYATLDLIPGNYQLSVTGTTSANAFLSRIPGE